MFMLVSITGPRNSRTVNNTYCTHIRSPTEHCALECTKPRLRQKGMSTKKTLKLYQLPSLCATARVRIRLR